MAANEPLPGTADIWEPEVLDWIELEDSARDVFHRYSYCELRTPIFERSDVFIRNLGDETDVVQKEMYSFQDRGGRNLSLRPEGTAGVIRAVAYRGLEQGEEARVFYFGPMFRGERPAAGRRRQFHQMGVEAVGNDSPWMDAECIAMLSHYLERLGIRGSRVMLNTRGTPADRPKVSAALVDYFTPQAPAMCEDCQRRLSTNVWRMLDCKNPACQSIAEQAPKIIDLISEDSRQFFTRVTQGLQDLGVSFELAPRLVRGLDYYIHTVFEVTHPGLGAQDALAGGGRYRIELPGSKKPVEGIGFAAGMERLLMARASLGLQAQAKAEADVMILSLGEGALLPGLQLTQQLRQSRNDLRIKADFSGRSLKAQLRGANKAGARLALIRGDNELAQNIVLCRDMHSSEQESVPCDELTNWLNSKLAPA
jgi:histidyl-tRNA synthetase